MKKIFILLAAALFFASTGCNEKSNGNCWDRIWDFNNYDISFLIVNAAGENLMDPEVEGNLLNDNIHVEYKGNTYLMNAEKTRDNPPIWQGLRTEMDNKTKQIVLKFGEFGPDDDYMDETFTLHWDDGTSDVVKFNLYLTWNNCDPTTHKKLWINGIIVSTDSLTAEIVKQD